MAEICATIAAIVGLVDAPDKIKKCLDPIIAQFRYLFCYNNFIQSLRAKNEELNRIRNGLQSEIDAAKRDLYEIKPDVEVWCERVDELKGKTQRILGDGDEQRVQNRTCLQGTCPNLKLQYSHSREAEKLITDIVERLNEYNCFRDNVKGPRVPVGDNIIPLTIDTLEFDSRKEIEEIIMSCLKDRSISMIEIWGMGGVGKTTMADKIRIRARDLFDETVKAVVSQQKLEQIQQQLAEPLGLHLTQEMTVTFRASLLRARLKDKNVLIILDDVWEQLKLEELGIPSQIKILLTTRNQDVCNSMSPEKATRILELKVLNEKDAFSLFCKNVGNVVDQANLRPLAMNVAKECKGLPLVLVIVGRSLRRENNESIWEASLGQLKLGAPTDIEGYLKFVYQPLLLSYERLESKEAQSLFLLCCLFPEDSKIEIGNLVRYGVGLRIFSTGRISDARHKADLLVKSLINRCLLMVDGRESLPTYVKMHDVIRDMALLIASRGEHVFKVSHDKDLKEWPSENYTCISLTLGDAKIFREDRHWPRLKALLLTFDLQTATTQKLPINNFFNGMEDLTLLSIHEQSWSTVVKVLYVPLSFLSSVTKLLVLHLHGCGLQDISLIGQLKDLKILSCRGSDIQVLPDEIGALKKLKLLDMTDCKRLENIAPGVFSALKQLEELRLMGCPIRWECEEEGDERRNASLTQVFSLENLTLLEIWIQDLEAIFQTMGDKQNLKKYSIVIGRAVVRGRSRTYLKCMSICLDRVDKRGVFPDAISKLFKDAEQLQLAGNGCEGIIELIGREGFKNTKYLEIDRLNNLEKIYNGPPPVELLSVLEYLSLRQLNELVYLWNCPNPKFSMSKLKEIKIEKCAKLKWLLPLPLSAKSLSQLESIEVSDCLSIDEVFKDERISESDITTIYLNFPILKRMMLHNLPRLGSLCNVVNAIIEFPSIEHLKITEVSRNFKVFDNRMDQVTCTNIKKLIMSHLGMEIFYRELPTSFVFSGLEELEIESFQSLKTLFSLAVFRSLSNLYELRVKDCMMLEYIVKMEDGENIIGQSLSVLSLPHLQRLQLSKLSKIRCFWPLINNALELPSLAEVTITDCPMIETFAEDQDSCSSSSMPNSSIPKCFFNKQVTCTNTKKLIMSHLGMEIFYRELPTGFVFSGLEELEIESFQSLKTLFSLVAFRSLSNLYELRVKDCMMLEYIVEMEDGENIIGQSLSVLSLPHLQRLQLSKLSKIRCFWPLINNALELPSLAEVTITDCPMIETFAEDQDSCSSSSMPNSSIPKCFFNKQVTCPKLDSLKLEGLKVTGLLFSPEIPIASLPALESLVIKSCHNLKSLFTCRMFEGLTRLMKLKVTNCSMLELMIAKDEIEETEDTIMLNLRCIKLEELPKLRGFSHMHRDLLLLSVERIWIRNCSEMMKSSFCLGHGCVRMPTGANVFGILDPEFASQFFSPKQQYRQSEDILNNSSSMLLPNDLSFIWDFEGESAYFMDPTDFKNYPIKEPYLVKGSSDVFFMDGWKKVCGKFDLKKLSPAITYEIVFVLMLLQRQYGDDKQLQSILADEKRDHKMMDMPTKKWIDILTGEVRPSAGQCGEITFSLEKSHIWTCIALRGVSIRPKETVA